VQQPPPDLDAALLPPALLRYGIVAATTTHAPVGFGDHHWTVGDTAGRHWFVTVSDLDDKPDMGADVESAAIGLRAAMDTAVELSRRLPFVVAPARTSDGAALVVLDRRWALAVFPFVDADPGPDPPGAVDEVLDLLVALHAAAVPAGVPIVPAQPAGRAGFDAALAECAAPWSGGPFAEQARHLLRERAAAVRAALDAFDDGAPAGPVVLTHGEPHRDNLVRTAAGWRLVDWDTVGVAPVERDLWHLLGWAPEADHPALLDRYARRTGRRPDPRVIAWHARRWDIDEAGLYLARFRAPHARTPDTGTAWESLCEALDGLAEPFVIDHWW
jgi:spectinomycin phosphotransferase